MLFPQYHHSFRIRYETMVTTIMLPDYSFECDSRSTFKISRLSLGGKLERSLHLGLKA